MGVHITEPRQTYIQSNAESEAKPAVVVAWSGGEARRQKRRLEGKAVVPHVLGGLQKTEKEEECSDIEKREEPGDSKSQRLIGRGDSNRKNRRDSRRPSHNPQKGTELEL
jgi:hypothetical protein